ncbi:MAG: DMT family transporter [Candidatus Neomarinimicrobiota bacterium]
MDTSRTKDLLADFVLFLAALIWGTTFALVKASLSYTTPFMFMTMRFTLALIIMTAVVSPHIKALSRRELTGGILTGGSIFLGFTFQTWGLVYTTASKSAFITGLNVVLVPFLLWGLIHQRIRAKRWIAAGLATVGLYLLTNPQSGAGINRGDLLTLACAVAFAVQIILLGIYAPTIHTLRYFWVQLITVTLLSALATLAVAGWEVTPSGTLWLGLGITGVLGTAGAFLGMTWAQRRTTPTRTALILTSEPVFGALFAVTIAGEFLSLIAWIGSALIVAVIIWSELGNQNPQAARA